ncbi:MAG: cation diffusion facilitator family transporter [Deltaproteobacteria bacterium]|nr:cation diffusion facilitator family transporter [Deltaproteobacteria bacterium]
MSHDSHHRPHDNAAPAERGASRRALWSALAILSVFMVVEVAGGLLTSSLALLSDAAHMLTDVAAVGLALFAQRIARRAPSPRRSYGYRRVEIVAALANGSVLWIMAALIVVVAVRRFADPPVIKGGLMIAVAVAGLVAQALAALTLARARHESLNVRGAYLHALTDAVQSVGVVAAGVVIVLTGFTLVDPIVSCLIALFIMWSGGKVVFEALHVLLEGTPREIDLEALARAMQGSPGVASVTDLHAWSLTTGYNALSAHVVACEGSGADDRERIREELTDLLRREFHIHHATLQVEKSCRMGGDAGCCGDWLDRANGEGSSNRPNGAGGACRE